MILQNEPLRCNFQSWRVAARALLRSDIRPEEVLWSDHERGGTLPWSDGVRLVGRATASLLRVPKQFVAAAEYVACHRDGQKWSLLYRLLWRLLHGEPGLLDDVVDDDVHLFLSMERAVRRDRHKMTAFVRFRRVETDAGEHFVAWHRPDHAILRLTTPFFVDRFGSMRWTILTPDQSASWDGHSVCFGEGVPARQAPRPDEIESLWRTYYANIFNPARVNLIAMRREMPRKHWPTLPETQDIPDLLRDAPGRVQTMVRATLRTSCTSTGSAADFLPARKSLPQLRAAAASCRGCDLYCNATQTVFGEGPRDAVLMFVGEQPGDQEDRAGRPFVGPSGQLLDATLHEAGITRDLVYVTNAVKHFKFETRGKRRIHSKPSAREVAACRPWLHEEIEAIRPKMIVTLGATAAQSLLGSGFRLTHHRHQIITNNDHAPLMLATIHPSAILRMPDNAVREQAKAELLKDMKIVAGHLVNAGT